MFKINEDLSIYITRGDSALFTVTATENGGQPHLFQPGDVVRMTVTERKNCVNVVMQKDFPVEEELESVLIYLEEKDTKIGDTISKPVDYWYEIELNPFTDPQTIIGYDENGAKVFRLFPEGHDLLPDIDEEDIPVVDADFSLTSQRPIQNQAVTRALIGFARIIESVVDVPATPKDYGAAGDGATDDTAAFKQALSENRIVRVPGGRYVLSDTLVVRANCCLELSQDTVLEFVNEEKNGIALLRAAHLRGNHATITVPYTFSANVIHCDTGDDQDALIGDDLSEANNTAVPPFVKWDPQWKMTRYVTDINICKPDDRGFHYSKDGDCYGTAISLHCDAADFVSYMWGVSMSGVRIAGGFEYGIRACNIGDAWNHDMRIEALIDACKVGVSMENCHYARLAVTVQPRRAYSDAEVYKAYAENGILLRGCRGIDLSGSRVWDWNAEATLWAEGNPYQHIALLGECRGLILDDFLYHEQSSIDIRRLIYTDTPANLENMTILQEPIDRYFKNKNGVPYFHDGSRDSKLISQEEMDAHFDTDFVKSFTDVLAAAEDTDGTVLNGVGYKIGARLHENGTLTESPYYGYTGFIPCAKGSTIYAKDLSFDVGDDFAKVIFYDADKNYINHVNRGNIIKGNNYYAAYTSKEDGFALTVNSISNNNDVAYARFTFYKTGFGEHPMMAVDEEIQYTVEGYLADSVKVKAKNVVSDIAAAVGQTIVVKSVDENGKPTEWAAVDFPECDVTSVNGQKGDVQTRLLVTITENEDGTYTSSHTSQEIYAASQAGAVVEGANITGGRYQTYVCSEQFVQFLTMSVSGGSGNRSLNTYGFLINGDKVIQSTTQTPIPVAPANMVGATASAAGTAGLVPKPAAGEQGKYLKGDGTWANIDCVQNPNTAAVGQAIVVKSVDENGKPTEWEAADIHSKAVLADFTLEEDVTSLILPLSDNPMNYSKILVELTLQLTEDSQCWTHLYSMEHGADYETIAHLNTIFSTSSVTTVWVNVDLYKNTVVSLANKKTSYQWNSTTQYGFAHNPSRPYPGKIDAIHFDSFNVKSGSRIRVEAIK